METIAMTLLTKKRNICKLTEWVPTIITFLLSLYVGIETSHLAEESAAREAFFNHRLDRAEKMVASFAEYTTVWGKLITTCKTRDKKAALYKKQLSNSTSQVERQKLESATKQLYDQQQTNIINTANNRNNIRGSCKTQSLSGINHRNGW
jgi:hypothetical protein